MGTIPRDLTGMRFDRWTVVEQAPKEGKNSRWVCRCDCGTVRIVGRPRLVSGGSRSCGCLVRDTNSAMRKTHGMSRTRIYKVWGAMIARCEKPSSTSYPRYGGRGITVCRRWRESFENFYADMGDRPTPAHSLDRIDNDGPYSPENCRWSDASEQGSNTRRNRYITHDGETLTAAEWAERAGISRTLLHNRLKAGWSIERALSRPARGS